MPSQAGSTEAEQLEASLPDMADQAQQLEQQLQAQEQVLQHLQEGIRGEVEQHTQALQQVRLQLAPWEQQISQVQSQLAVATAEQDMLQRSHSEAKQRLKVSSDCLARVSDIPAVDWAHWCAHARS